MRASRRHTKLMSGRSWAVVIAMAVIAATIVINLVYHSIMDERWEEEWAVKNHVLANSELVEINDIHKFVWDGTTWILQGKDASGEPLIAWVNDDKLDVIRAADVWGKAETAAQFNADRPNAKLLRQQLGVINGTQAWEFFYSNMDNGSRRYYYDYYRLSDGKRIVTYNLPAKAGTSP